MKNLLFIAIVSATLIGCQTEEDKLEYQQALSKAKFGVQNWIKEHAKYPNSYVPISFSEFSMSHAKNRGIKIEGSENYEIKHAHKLINRDSQLVSFQGYFILENDLDVSLIEIKRTNVVGGTFPPIVDVWIDKFGREANSLDSTKFKLKERQLKNRIEIELDSLLDLAMNNEDVDQYYKNVYTEGHIISTAKHDDSIMLSITEKLSSCPKELEYFYFLVHTKSMNESDGFYSEAIGNTSYEYTLNHLDKLTNYFTHSSHLSDEDMIN